MDRGEVLKIENALGDFRAARRKAVLSDLIRVVQGDSRKLLSFEQARRSLKTQMTGRQIIKDIPLNAIVGSVNRYEDFTRGFLPRKTIDPNRWASVQKAQYSMEGLPPIEAYQIDQAYFVLDGNHRVSVARQMGMKTIQGLVTEIPTRVKLTPDATPEDLIIQSEYLDFLEATRLDQTRPEANLEMTAAGQYQKILQIIVEHQEHIRQKKKREITLEEAASNWYDTKYLPLVNALSSNGLLRDFPGRSLADLYAWLVDKSEQIEKDLGINVNIELAASRLTKQFSPSTWQATNRVLTRIKDMLIPDALEAGPEAGEWRKEVVNYRGNEVLFNDILVPVSGTAQSWLALDQAQIIAKKEAANLYGLHISRTQAQKNQAKLNQIQQDFQSRCQKAGLEGKLTQATGDPARRISERAVWSDLVVINLSFPPQPQALSKYRSGFRSLVLRCPRPILAVPQRVSPLERALLAYDASPKAQEALYVATYLAGKWGIQLVVLTIREEDATKDESQQKAREYLESHGVQATYEEIAGPVANSILIIAEEHHCDWIIMGGYGSAPIVNFMLDNVVDRVIRSSGRPMLLCR